MKSNKSSFDEVFLEEIKYIIRNSIYLRWIIACVILLLPIALPIFGFFIKPVPILIIGVVTILYNIGFYFYRKFIIESKEEGLRLLEYRKLGRIQIFFDYLALAVTLYFIGGVHTNLLYILFFHIVIGSVVLSAAYMYFMVIISLVGFYVLSILELNSILPYYNFYNLPITLTYKSISTEFLIHFIILMSSVFIISFLTNKIKSDNKKIQRAKDNLEKNYEAMKALEVRKSKFMRYSAHQLRSPLATILSALNILTAKMIPLESERAFNLLNGANQRGMALLEIVNSLLELSRIREERKQISHGEEINIVEMIEKIIFSIIEQVENKKLSITRVYDIRGQKYRYPEVIKYHEDFKTHLAALPPDCIIIGNSEHLKHGFYNIIENAIKYSYKGGKIFIDLICDEYTMPQVYIRDEGIGIDKEYLDDVFLEFVRSPNAKDFENEGTGLGLPLAKEVFDEHNAVVTVSSEVGKGTTFVIKF